MAPYDVAKAIRAGPYEEVVGLFRDGHLLALERTVAVDVKLQHLFRRQAVPGQVLHATS
jgi:hypothetical protein